MKKVLFVSHTFNQKRANGDPSVWYRVHGCAKAFGEMGYLSETLNYWEMSEKKIDLSCYEAIIFFRPIPSKDLFNIIEKAQSLNIKCVASYDDPIFDTGAFATDSTLKSGAAGILMNQRYRDWANAFAVFDDFIASTEMLSSRIKKIKPNANVYLINNFLPTEYIKFAATLRNKPFITEKLIGYFAGGKSHLKDIQLISKPLLTFCQAENYKILLPECFRQNLSPELNEYSIFFPRVSYAGLLVYYSKVDIAIAPLEIDNNSSCKSAIKYYEAIASYKPLVSSPMDALLKIENKETLLLADNDTEWVEKLHLAAQLSPEQLKAERDALIKELDMLKKEQIDYFMES